MSKRLYIIALILIIGWLIGFIGFQSNGIIHLLLAMAVIAAVLSLILENKLLTKNQLLNQTSS